MPKKKKKKSADKTVVKYDGKQHMVKKELAAAVQELLRAGFEPTVSDEYKNKYSTDFENMIFEEQQEVVDFYDICQKIDSKNEVNISKSWYIESFMKKTESKNYKLIFVVNFPITDIDFIYRCFTLHNEEADRDDDSDEEDDPREKKITQPTGPPYNVPVTSTALIKVEPAKIEVKKIKYLDTEAEVETLLAPIILEMWKCDMKTLPYIRKIDSEMMTIKFVDWADAQKFIDIIRDKDPRARRRIYEEWDFDAIIYNHEELNLSVATMFPKSDIGMILGALKLYSVKMIEIGIKKLETMKNTPPVSMLD